MDEFGRSHAGRPCSTEDFTEHVSKTAHRDLSRFFHYWMSETGLPRFKLTSVRLADETVHGQLQATGGPLPTSIEVSLETPNDERTEVVQLDPQGRFELGALPQATRLVVDKYARAARANGSEADLNAFAEDIDRALIVYGTRTDEAANREAAETCQKAIRRSWFNVDLPIRTDQTIAQSELKSSHLILIGRPEANQITARLAKALPVTFGSSSFIARAQTYAHVESAVLAAGVNPENRHYSVVVIAGNSAAATLAHAGELGGREQRPEILVHEAGGKTRSLVAPAAELTKVLAGR
jgi:hypothetical protein